MRGGLNSFPKGPFWPRTRSGWGRGDLRLAGMSRTVLTPHVDGGEQRDTVPASTTWPGDPHNASSPPQSCPPSLGLSKTTVSSTGRGKCSSGSWQSRRRDAAGQHHPETCPAPAPLDAEDGICSAHAPCVSKAFPWDLCCWNPLPEEKLEIKQLYFDKVPSIAKISHQMLIVPCTLD